MKFFFTCAVTGRRMFARNIRPTRDGLKAEFIGSAPTDGSTGWMAPKGKYPIGVAFHRGLFAKINMIGTNPVVPRLVTIMPRLTFF